MERPFPVFRREYQDAENWSDIGGGRRPAKSTRPIGHDRGAVFSIRQFPRIDSGVSVHVPYVC